MRATFALVLLAAAPHARATIGAASSDALRSVQLDPAACYRVRDLQFQRGGVGFFLNDGYLIFSKPASFGGRPAAPFAAVFAATTPTGDAEVVLTPPTPDERRNLNARTGSPNLDDHVRDAAFFFADDTYAELTRQIRASEFNVADAAAGGELAAHYAALPNIAARFHTQLLLGLLNGNGSKRAYFAAVVGSQGLGVYDVVFDPGAPEPVLVFGQRNHEDTHVALWTSYTPKGFTAARPSGFDPTGYKIAATIDPALKLSAESTFDVNIAQSAGALHALEFDLSRQMRVVSAEIDGEPADVVDTLMAPPSGEEDTDDRQFLLVPESALAPGSKHKVRVVHEGDVITSAPNGIYFVGSRGRWYPHVQLDFSQFDLLFRFPKTLDLVAPGTPTVDREEGPDKIIGRSIHVPLPMVGFNLGNYSETKIQSGPFEIDLCAHRGEDTGENVAANLDVQAKELGSALEFYTARFGPPPLKRLVVSPIPGRFGQGFGGLIYLSTLAYAGPGAQALAEYDHETRLFFTKLMQAHEAAHQWWGNIVTTAGYHDDWLMEALANDSAFAWIESTSGPGVSESLLNAYKATLLSKNPDGRTVDAVGPLTQGHRLEYMVRPPAWVPIVYGKGAWVLRMLHAILGDPGYGDMLRALRERYALRAITTEQFQELSAEFMPKGSPDPHLEAFFDQWVHSTGIPKLALKTSLKRGASGAVLTATLTQSEVAEDFSAYFPIDIEFKDHTERRWIQSSSDPSTITVKLATSPISVVLDAKNQFLKR